MAIIDIKKLSVSHEIKVKALREQLPNFLANMATLSTQTVDFKADSLEKKVRKQGLSPVSWSDKSVTKLTEKGNRLMAKLEKRHAKTPHKALVRKNRLPNSFTWIEGERTNLTSKPAQNKKQVSPVKVRESKDFKAFMETQNSVRVLLR